MSTFVNKPVNNLKQNFNDTEKKRARDNIDALSVSHVLSGDHDVRYYTKDEVDAFIRNWSGYVVIPFGQQKPAAKDADLGKIYLVQVSNDPDVQDKYEEWISDGTAWSMIGTRSIDLRPYDLIEDAEARELVITHALNAHIEDSLKHITAAERTAWNAKQDAITDLDTIRSGAAAGATALQPSAISDMETKTHAASTYQPKGSYEPAFTKLPISKGGTDATTAKEARFKLSGNMKEEDSDFGETSLILSRYVTPSADNGAWYVRTAKHLWNYINGEAGKIYAKITSLGSLAFKSSITKSDITDFPSSIPADGGDAYRLYSKRNAMPDGTAVTDLNNFYALSRVIFGEFQGSQVANCPVTNWVLVESRCGADTSIYVTQIATRMTGNMSGSTETANNGDMWIRTCNGGAWTSWVKYVKPKDIPTSLPAIDVYPWAKEETKPTYTASEVGAATSNHAHGAIDNGGHIWAANQVDIGNGDRLVIVDSSENSLLKRSSNTFDGTTKTSFLSRSGTFEDTAAAARVIKGYATSADNTDATVHFRATTNGIVLSASEESGKHKEIYFRTGITTDNNRMAYIDSEGVYHGNVKGDLDGTATNATDALVAKVAKVAEVAEALNLEGQIGSMLQPIYFLNGKPTRSTDVDLGNSYKPIYMNNGTLKACNFEIFVGTAYDSTKGSDVIQIISG